MHEERDYNTIKYLNLFHIDKNLYTLGVPCNATQVYFKMVLVVLVKGTISLLALIVFTEKY